MILEAKYYNVLWHEEGTVIYNQPGIGDIAKQIFYQMAFKNLIDKQLEKTDKKPTIVNAFLFPEDDEEQPIIRVSEIVQLGWKTGTNAIEPATGFCDVLLFGVRIPGIELLRRYAFGEIADKWFEEIVVGEEEARTTWAKLKQSC